MDRDLPGTSHRCSVRLGSGKFSRLGLLPLTGPERFRDVPAFLVLLVERPSSGALFGLHGCLGQMVRIRWRQRVLHEGEIQINSP